MIRDWMRRHEFPDTYVIMYKEVKGGCVIRTYTSENKISHKDMNRLRNGEVLSAGIHKETRICDIMYEVIEQ